MIKQTSKVGLSNQHKKRLVQVSVSMTRTQKEIEAILLAYDTFLSDYENEYGYSYRRKRTR